MTQTSVEPNSRKPGLAARLREETVVDHRAAERGAFMRVLLRGQLTPGRYANYLLALWPIYDTLERGLARHADNPIVGPLVLPALFRAAAIARDLHDLFDLQPTALPAVPAAIGYALRLRRLADMAPDLLVAHAYTRYLGDLSGGQSLRSGAARVLGLAANAAPGTAGLSFYDFPAVTDIAVCKDEFRARLDALPVNAVVADEIVAEARRAFARTSAVFGQVLPDNTGSETSARPEFVARA